MRQSSSPPSAAAPPRLGRRPERQPLWAELARRWAQLGPPLRPAPEDVSFYRTEMLAWANVNGPPRGLILGVTPELHDLPWPAGSRVLAGDKCEQMIEAVWPGAPDEVLRADWTALPLPDESCDVVLTDGGLLQMPYPDGHRAVVRELARIVPAGGICVFRFFCSPALRESPAAVLDELLDGRIPDLNQLKVRLAASLQQDAAEGVELRHVWNALRDVAPNLEALAVRIGWSIQHLRAIDAYRDQTTRYHFLSLGQIHDVFCERSGFVLQRIHAPSYLLAERFPTLVLRRCVAG